MVCINALNRTVNEYGIFETGKILDKVRELVLNVFKKSSETINDGMDISLCRIDLETREIQWSGANNQLLYIQNNEIKTIKPDKQHIGKTDNLFPFTTHFIDACANTAFYLFTDGFHDQFGGDSGKKFKFKQMSDLLLLNQKLALKDQSTFLDETFMNWKGELEQVDDVCIIGFKI
jgi:serine phosphatase RsbU (regulator of sigma subunit)